MSHFSNTRFYKPVEPHDVADSDLESMTNDFNKALMEIAKRTPNADQRKIVESQVSPPKSRFPQARINLKTHKPGITSENIPGRPIVSNINSPTARLASYLGKCLTSVLGEVSDKHL